MCLHAYTETCRRRTQYKRKKVAAAISADNEESQQAAAKQAKTPPLQAWEGLLLPPQMLSLVPCLRRARRSSALGEGDQWYSDALLFLYGAATLGAAVVLSPFAAAAIAASLLLRHSVQHSVPLTPPFVELPVTGAK